jgi:hypothetical protein
MSRKELKDMARHGIPDIVRQKVKGRSLAHKALHVNIDWVGMALFVWWSCNA